mmetsp:Transcript_5080/g.10132  ORF Transcript_5080/g.10132 Transcript_5080/m.10132 type:complete len:92 (+) Transcript_5080:3-278(+)
MDLQPLSKAPSASVKSPFTKVWTHSRKCAGGDQADLFLKFDPASNFFGQSISRQKRKENENKSPDQSREKKGERKIRGRKNNERCAGCADQ